MKLRLNLTKFNENRGYVFFACEIFVVKTGQNFNNVIKVKSPN